MRAYVAFVIIKFDSELDRVEKLFAVFLISARFASILVIYGVGKPAESGTRAPRLAGKEGRRTRPPLYGPSMPNNFGPGHS